MPKILLAATLALAATMAVDGSENLKLADLPVIVRKAVLQQKQQGSIFRIEKASRDGREVYSAQVRSGASTKTFFIDEAGMVLEVREPLALSTLPPAAKKAIESSVGEGKILRLESVKLASGLIAAYEVRFKRNGVESNLRIAPDGRLVQE